MKIKAIQDAIDFEPSAIIIQVIGRPKPIILKKWQIQPVVDWSIGVLTCTVPENNYNRLIVIDIDKITDIEILY